MNRDKNCETQCNIVDDFANLEECENNIVESKLSKPGMKILHLPVNLAELTVGTNLSANIKFPCPVLEIKDIKKRVKIIQCSLLLPSIRKGTHDPFCIEGFPAFRLFIKGFVRKNIQYATPISENHGECISSEIRSLTVDIPFSCVTKITEFTSPPQLPYSNTSSEFDFLRVQELGHGFPEKDHLLSSDLSQFHQESTQYYNQLPFCELISSHIIGWEEAIDRKPLCGHGVSEGLFHQIEEKTVLEFTVRILQNQQVRLKAL